MQVPQENILHKPHVAGQSTSATGRTHPPSSRAKAQEYVVTSDLPHLCAVIKSCSSLWSVHVAADKAAIVAVLVCKSREEGGNARLGLVALTHPTQVWHLASAWLEVGSVRKSHPAGLPRMGSQGSIHRRCPLQWHTRQMGRQCAFHLLRMQPSSRVPQPCTRHMHRGAACVHL